MIQGTRSIPHRRKKLKSAKEVKYLGTQVFHLDGQETQLTSKAKQQLQKFSSFSMWDLAQSSLLKNKISSIKQITSWEELGVQNQQESDLKKPKFNTVHPIRIKTQMVKFKFAKLAKGQQNFHLKTQDNINNCQQEYQQNLPQTGANLSIQNISPLIPSQQFVNQSSSYSKNRPLTGEKKQLIKKIITVVPYGNNNSALTTSHFRYRTQPDQQRISCVQINGGSLSNFTLKNPIKNIKNQKRSSLRSQPLSTKIRTCRNSNLLQIPNNNNGIGGSLIKSKNLSKKQKWLTKASISTYQKRSYKIDSQSPLKNQFQRITQLLKQQISNLGYSQQDPIIIKKC